MMTAIDLTEQHMKPPTFLIGTAILAVIISGCGDPLYVYTSGSQPSFTDVTVVDGYVAVGNVTDSSGQQAVTLNKPVGVYRFMQSPVYPIRFTVGYGVVAETNMTMDINMSAASGNVISPVTTIAGDDQAIIGNLATVMHLANSDELFSDYIENNNTDLAKLSQLCYAMLKDTNTTRPFLKHLTADFDPSADGNISALIDNTISKDVNWYSTKVFLKAVRNYQGTAKNMETSLVEAKVDVGYYYEVNNTSLPALISNYTYATDAAQKALYAKELRYADTTAVTQMQWLFNGNVYFNLDIGGWNTSNVTDMSFMFSNAEAFNQPIGNWDTSKVTTMAQMFQGAWAFNQPIGEWNTSNVTDMSAMFGTAEAFNQPIGNWDTSRVTDMSAMFLAAFAFDQNISGWNVSAVGNNHVSFDLESGFEGQTALQPQWQ